MSEGVFGIEVLGDCHPGWLKWEGRSPQVGKDFWDTVSPINSLSSKSPWETQGQLECHALPTWYKATPNHPAIVLPLARCPSLGMTMDAWRWVMCWAWWEMKHSPSFPSVGMPS